MDGQLRQGTWCRICNQLSVAFGHAAIAAMDIHELPCFVNQLARDECHAARAGK